VEHEPAPRTGRSRDRVYFFISGPAAGVYVVAQVVSPVYESKEPDEFGKYKVDVEYTAFVDPYIPRSILTDAATEPILAAYVPFKGSSRRTSCCRLMLRRGSTRCPPPASGRSPRSHGRALICPSTP